MENLKVKLKVKLKEAWRRVMSKATDLGKIWMNTCVQQMNAHIFSLFLSFEVGCVDAQR